MRIPLYRTVLLPRSKADLNEIGDYISDLSVEGAAKVIEEIMAMIDSLQRLPNRHKVHEARKKPELSVYVVPAGKYLIYYRVDEPARLVRILRVLHGARRQPKRFR